MFDQSVLWAISQFFNRTIKKKKVLLKKWKEGNKKSIEDTCFSQERLRGNLDFLGLQYNWAVKHVEEKQNEGIKTTANNPDKI